MPQKATPPSRFVLVRKPDSQGTVVAKFDVSGQTEIEIPESCVLYSVSKQSDLANHTIDRSQLTDAEKEVLGYPP